MKKNKMMMSDKEMKEMEKEMMKEKKKKFNAGGFARAKKAHFKTK